MAEKTKRINTYLRKEYFKVICLAKSKEQTHEFAKFLSGSNNNKKGVYNSAFNKTQIVVFPRYVSKLDHQATTVSVEALVVYLENKNEMEDIKSILNRYHHVPIRVVVSNFDATDEAKSIDAKWKQMPEDGHELRVYLDDLDKEEFITIKKKFDHYDEDQGGYIDNDEMKKIATEMGFDPNDENFNKSIYALDLNQDGNISLNEFVTWWKIGRQNTYALPLIYDLYQNSQDFTAKFFNYENFMNDINIINEEQKVNQSFQKLKFRSPGAYKLKTIFEFSAAIGAQKRLEMANEFISKFTSNVGNAGKANFLSILIPLNSKQKKLNIEKGKILVDEFKDNCMKWLEEKVGKNIAAFFQNLIVFETNSNETSLILAMRLKIDIEELVKTSLQQLISIFANLQFENNSTWINVKAHSNLDIYDVLNREVSIKEFFEVSEFYLEGSTYKDQVQALFNSLTKEYKGKLDLLQFFYRPDSVDLELEGKLEDLLNDSSSLNGNINYLAGLLDFLKSNLSKELLSAANNLEIALNFCDIFARIKFFSQSTFNENSNLK